MERGLPNFLVVGAAKSGTTSLFNYLNQHPQIFIPAIKECRFFSQMPRNQKGLGAEKFQNEGIRDWEEYQRLFQGRKESRLGDISNDYLYFYQKSIQNIKAYLGSDVKIIISLRNPIDRAYSNYLHAIREGWENLSFEEAIKAEQTRIAQGWAWPYHYVKVGLYYRQVKSYLSSFKDVKIFLFEDFKDTKLLLDNVVEFLEVPPFNFSTDKLYNVSGYPKSKLLHKFLLKDFLIKRIISFLIFKTFSEDVRKRLRAKILEKNLKKEPMRPETRRYLREVYKDDILKLQELIGRDLTSWLA